MSRSGWRVKVRVGRASPPCAGPLSAAVDQRWRWRQVHPERSALGVSLGHPLQLVRRQRPALDRPGPFLGTFEVRRASAPVISASFSALRRSSKRFRRSVIAASLSSPVPMIVSEPCFDQDGVHKPCRTSVRCRGRRTWGRGSSDPGGVPGRRARLARGGRGRSWRSDQASPGKGGGSGPPCPCTSSTRRRYSLRSRAAVACRKAASGEPGSLDSSSRSTPRKLASTTSA